VGNIPQGRLMLESDAPYLLPRSLRPKPKNCCTGVPAGGTARVASHRGESAEHTGSMYHGNGAGFLPAPESRVFLAVNTVDMHQHMSRMRAQ
jgi:TatD DNase family protein